MNRIALAALTIGVALVPASASAGPPPISLPCDYWVHGCHVAEYVCDAVTCDAINLPPKPVSSRD